MVSNKAPKYRLRRGQEYVLQALDLYTKVFVRSKEAQAGDQNTNNDKYSNIDTWSERANHGLLLLANTEENMLVSESSQEDQGRTIPIGFCLSYPRKLEVCTPTGKGRSAEENFTSKSWHIWLAGVLPEYRGQGVWTSMLHETIDAAQDLPVTIATIPDIFPNMYRSLLREGFERYSKDTGKTVWSRNHAGEGKEPEKIRGKVNLILRR